MVAESKVRLKVEYPLRVGHTSRHEYFPQYESCISHNTCIYYSCMNLEKLQGGMIDGIPGFLVDEGVDTFRVIKGIGCCSDGIPVYKAELFGSHSIRWRRDRFYAIKCVDRGHKELEQKLKLQVAKSRTLRSRDRSFGLSSAIVECLRQFYHDGRYYCCVFPLMEHGSLRGLMADRFPHGFPEQHDDDGFSILLFLLYRALQALDVLHRLGHAHGELSAAHVFVGGTGSVKLAFSASMQDLLADKARDSVSPYMPSASVCKWAAAPEAEGTHTKEADIWLLGITALELAYGGLPLMCKDELHSILRKINVDRRLPKNLNNTSNNNHKSAFPFCCFTRSAVFPLDFPRKKRVFSQGFLNFVVACLHFEPAKRPTADQLLRCDLFKTLQRSYFLPPYLFASHF